MLKRRFSLLARDDDRQFPTYDFTLRYTLAIWAEGSDTDELESGVSEARERSNGKRTLYATSGCGDNAGES